jgi:hypothetical protein
MIELEEKLRVAKSLFIFKTRLGWKRNTAHMSIVNNARHVRARGRECLSRHSFPLLARLMRIRLIASSKISGEFVGRCSGMQAHIMQLPAIRDALFARVHSRKRP